MSVRALQQETQIDLPPGVRPSDSRLPPVPIEGFLSYWYPVMFARKLGSRPIERKLLGQDVLFIRSNGKVHAMQAACPHRGAALKLGMALAPDVLTCRYHGFSFDMNDGRCVAALTEGPCSLSVNKLRARIYPVEERHGLIWVYMGEGEPPPLEEDLPEEYQAKDAVVVARFSVWGANWRVSVDNGGDAAHVPFLHRNHPMVRFQKLPSFFKVATKRDGKWLRLVLEDIGFVADYPRIGRWPRDLRFRRSGAPAQTSIRLPGIVRIVFPGKYTHCRWSVPIDSNSTLIVQTLVRPARGLGAAWFKLYYYLWEKWLYHVSFQKDDEDVLMTVDRLAPEHLTQSDLIIVQWRRMASEARGAKAELGSAS